MQQISASSNSILVRDVAHLATKQNIKLEKRDFGISLGNGVLFKKVQLNQCKEH